MDEKDYFTNAPPGGCRLGGKIYQGGEKIAFQHLPALQQLYRRNNGLGSGKEADGGFSLISQRGGIGRTSERPIDLANQFPLAAPNFGRSILPHVMTFRGMVTTLSKAYRYSDNALRDSIQNAHMMLNDPMIMGPLFIRMRMVALLNWSIEPGDDDDPKEKKLAEDLTRILKRTPWFVKYLETLGLAIWFGRYGIQNKYKVHTKYGKRSYVIGNWVPLSGDKLLFRYDDGSGQYDPDQIGVKVTPALAKRDYIQGNRKLEASADGLGYFLEPWERSRISVHRHVYMDGEFEDPLAGGMIHGVGARSFLYWTWYQKQETMQQIAELTERTAAGFTIYWYPMHNPAAKARVESIAETQAHTNIITMPFDSSDPEAYRIEQIPPNTAGISALQDLIDRHFQHLILRFILGQTLSVESAATGLGSGVADLHKNSLYNVIKYDAVGMEETVTREVIENLKNFNFPSMRNADVFFRLSTESSNPAEMIAAAQAMYAMGAELKTTDLYDMVGLSQPKEDDEKLFVPELLDMRKKYEQQMQMEEGTNGAGNPMGQILGPGGEPLTIPGSENGVPLPDPGLSEQPPEGQETFALDDSRSKPQPIRYDLQEDEGPIPGHERVYHVQRAGGYIGEQGGPIEVYTDPEHLNDLGFSLPSTGKSEIVSLDVPSDKIEQVGDRISRIDPIHIGQQVARFPFSTPNEIMLKAQSGELGRHIQESQRDHNTAVGLSKRIIDQPDPDNRGFTYQPIIDYSPISGWSVSPHKDQETIHLSPYNDPNVNSPADITPEHYEEAYNNIQKFLQGHWHQFDNPKMFAGGWEAPDDSGKLYHWYDLSIVVPEWEEARQVAIDNDQLAAYNLETRETRYVKETHAKTEEDFDASQDYGQEGARRPGSSNDAFDAWSQTRRDKSLHRKENYGVTTRDRSHHKVPYAEGDVQKELPFDSGESLPGMPRSTPSPGATGPDADPNVPKKPPLPAPPSSKPRIASESSFGSQPLMPESEGGSARPLGPDSDYVDPGPRPIIKMDPKVDRFHPDYAGPPLNELGGPLETDTGSRAPMEPDAAEEVGMRSWKAKNPDAPSPSEVARIARGQDVGAQATPETGLAGTEDFTGPVQPVRREEDFTLIPEPAKEPPPEIGSSQSGEGAQPVGGGVISESELDDLRKRPLRGPGDPKWETGVAEPEPPPRIPLIHPGTGREMTAEQVAANPQAARDLARQQGLNPDAYAPNQYIIPEVVEETPPGRAAEEARGPIPGQPPAAPGETTEQSTQPEGPPSGSAEAQATGQMDADDALDAVMGMSEGTTIGDWKRTNYMGTQVWVNEKTGVALPDRSFVKEVSPGVIDAFANQGARPHHGDIAKMYGHDPKDLDGSQVDDLMMHLASRFNYSPPGGTKQEKASNAARWLTDQHPKLQATVQAAEKLGYKPDPKRGTIDQSAGAWSWIMSKAHSAGHKPDDKKNPFEQLNEAVDFMEGGTTDKVLSQIGRYLKSNPDLVKGLAIGAGIWFASSAINRIIGGIVGGADDIFGTFTGGGRRRFQKLGEEDPDRHAKEDEEGEPQRYHELEDDEDHEWHHRFPRRRVDGEPQQYAAPAGSRLFNQPHLDAEDVAQTYLSKFPEGSEIGRGEVELTRRISEENSKRIADAFDAMQHNPNDPEVRQAYVDMANETLDQYQHLIDNGYQFEMLGADSGNPYPHSQAMIDDLDENNHMYVFPTEEGFGEEGMTQQDHPMLSPTDFEDVNGRPMLVNDAFRAVHDYFGHARHGNGFGPVGEENAWMTHSQMYTPNARRAMTTETRGQNSWVNFGQHLRDDAGNVPKKDEPGYLHPSERPFSEQKMGLLPDEHVFGSSGGSSPGLPPASPEVPSMPDEPQAAKKVGYPFKYVMMKQKVEHYPYQEGSSLPLSKVNDSGVTMKTGEPVEFTFLRGTTPSPDMGERFQQHIEPTGRYMVHNENPQSFLDHIGPEESGKFETGTHKFNNPLVMKFNHVDHSSYDDNSWKSVLHNHYGGLVGNDLSQAIRNDGYDGIVTTGQGDYAKEIVDLTHLSPSGDSDKNRNANGNTTYLTDDVIAMDESRPNLRFASSNVSESYSKEDIERTRKILCDFKFTK